MDELNALTNLHYANLSYYGYTGELLFWYKKRLFRKPKLDNVSILVKNLNGTVSIETMHVFIEKHKVVLRSIDSDLANYKHPVFYLALKEKEKALGKVVGLRLLNQLGKTAKSKPLIGIIELSMILFSGFIPQQDKIKKAAKLTEWGLWKAPIEITNKYPMQANERNSKN